MPSAVWRPRKSASVHGQKQPTGAETRSPAAAFPPGPDVRPGIRTPHHPPTATTRRSSRPRGVGRPRRGDAHSCAPAPRSDEPSPPGLGQSGRLPAPCASRHGPGATGRMRIHNCGRPARRRVATARRGDGHSAGTKAVAARRCVRCRTFSPRCPAVCAGQRGRAGNASWPFCGCTDIPSAANRLPGGAWPGTWPPPRLASGLANSARWPRARHAGTRAGSPGVPGGGHGAPPLTCALTAGAPASLARPGVRLTNTMPASHARTCMPRHRCARERASHAILTRLRRSGGLSIRCADPHRRA